MFLIAFCSPKQSKNEGELYIVHGKAFGSSNSWRTKLWSSIALCQSRSKYARKEQRREEKQSEENRGQQLQSYFALLELFPKSIFYIMYTISNIRKSRIQRFKRCTNWSLNEEDMALARQLHPAHFHPGRNSIRLPPFPSGCITSGIRLMPLPPLPSLTSDATSTPRMTSGILLHRPFHLMSYIWNSGAGWERRRFNFSISHVRILHGAYPDHSKLKAECCTVPRCSPEASWYFRPTVWDILGYFALDIWCLNSQNLLVIHQP